jgi:hypothetical protein
MKFLNFGRVKKQAADFIKGVAKFFKKEYKKAEVEQEKTQAPSGSYLRRKGGCKNYTHILIPLNSRFKKIYRDFKKQQLPGKKMFIGKILYKIEVNPAYGR